MTPIHLTPEELVERWRNEVALGTLANWRYANPPKGPVWIKVGTKVLYPVAEVEKYERERQVA